MDPYTVGGMIFSVVMVLLVGGFIVSFPILRRLGGLMEEMIRERRESRLSKGTTSEIQEEIAGLRAAFEALDQQVERLNDRQEFVENLLSPERDKGLIPPSG